MVERGARHLLLLGRRPASETAGAVIAQLEQKGASVATAQADVSSAAQMARVLSAIDERLPLRGIVHAAGILDDGLLLQQDWERFTRVMAPKIEGAWNLHNLTLGCELDFFVLFSSMASLVGSPGQSNYAAANAFLDGLAADRRAQGLPAISINWGPWAEVGMAAAQHQMDERMKLVGVRALAPQAALQVLEQLLPQPVAQIGVVDINWRRFQPGATPPPLLAGLIQRASAQGPERSHFREVLRAAASEERQPMLEDYLRQRLAQVLRAAPSGIDVEQPWSNLGIDSLMAIELRTKIQTDLRVVVPIAQVLQGPTLRRMAALLLEQLTTHWLAEAPPSDGQEWEVLTI
jgi:short-subunit dehydrogenase/acyl carrier protein